MGAATRPWEATRRAAPNSSGPKATEQVFMSKQLNAEIRELTDDEIDEVDGGLVVIAIIAILIGLLRPA